MWGRVLLLLAAGHARCHRWYSIVATRSLWFLDGAKREHIRRRYHRTSCMNSGSTLLGDDVPILNG